MHCISMHCFKSCIAFWLHKLYSIKEHIQNCCSCSQEQDLNSFTVIRKCNTAYEAKIQEALLIKKQNLELKKQLCATAVSVLLNIY